MQIHRVQVFDPLYHPLGGMTLPARVEVLISGVDLFDPTRTDIEGGWTVAWYGEFFCLFWHEGELGEKPLPDDEYNEEALTFHEGWINVEPGILPEPVFPVTVTDGHSPMRDFFAPASLVQSWLEKDVTQSAVGSWKLVANTDYALRGQIVFALEFTPHRSRDLRAENARLTQG